jgi:hypothetical protein
MKQNTAQPYGIIPADEGSIWFALNKTECRGAAREHRTSASYDVTWLVSYQSRPSRRTDVTGKTDSRHHITRYLKCLGVQMQQHKLVSYGSSGRISA